MWISLVLCSNSIVTSIITKMWFSLKSYITFYLILIWKWHCTIQLLSICISVIFNSIVIYITDYGNGMVGEPEAAWSLVSCGFISRVSVGSTSWRGGGAAAESPGSKKGESKTGHYMNRLRMWEWDERVVHRWRLGGADQIVMLVAREAHGNLLSERNVLRREWEDKTSRLDGSRGFITRIIGRQS